MKPSYIIGSLDNPLFLIVHSHHPTAKKLITYETTEDDAIATRFDFYSTAAWALLQLQIHHPAIAALNLCPLPIKGGQVQQVQAAQYGLPS